MGEEGQDDPENALEPVPPLSSGDRGSLFLTYAAVSRQRLEVIEEQYRQHFIAGEEIFQDYARNLSADLETLAANPAVRNRADQGFTSFLTADPETFRYAYTPEELDIIRLFQDYRNYHPDVNAIYMGRENGTFVRSHPRESATAYDPRVRPWYILGKGQPEGVQITYAYPSLTTQDVNIGFVRALVDESGAVYGVLGMDVTLKTLSERLASLPLTGGGWMEVADTQGRIIMSPREERVDTLLEKESGYSPLEEFQGMEIAQGREDYRMIWDKEFWGGRFIAYVPKAYVEGAVWSRVGTMALQSLSVLFFLGLWSLLLMRIYVGKPLSTLSKSLEGATERGVLEPLPAVSKGELGRFVEEYNRLVDQVRAKEETAREARNLTVSSLASLSTMRDYETGLHLIRTARFVEALAKGFSLAHPEEEIPSWKIELMAECAPLHDIGKVGIRDEILLKDGLLTPKEYEEMKRHPSIGRQTLLGSGYRRLDPQFMEVAENMIYLHHERWDGEGYPLGLKGEEIPIEARVMALADAYDAITTRRVYKEARKHEEALAILKAEQGRQFDPRLVEVCLEIQGQMLSIARAFQE